MAHQITHWWPHSETSSVKWTACASESSDFPLQKHTAVSGHSVIMYQTTAMRGTGIRRRRNVKSWHSAALDISHLVRFFKGHNRTVVQMQIGTGIWSNELSIWRLLCLQCSEQYKADTLLEQFCCNWWNMGKSMNCHSMPDVWMASSRNHKNTRFEKPITRDSDQHFHPWRPRCYCASSRIVKIRMHTITSHFCSTVCDIQVVWSVQKLFKMPSSYLVMLEPTRQTLSRTCSGTEGVNSGKPPSLFFQTQFM